MNLSDGCSFHITYLASWVVCLNVYFARLGSIGLGESMQRTVSENSEDFDDREDSDACLYSQQAAKVKAPYVTLWGLTAEPSKIVHGTDQRGRGFVLW